MVGFIEDNYALGFQKLQATKMQKYPQEKELTYMP